VRFVLVVHGEVEGGQDDPPLSQTGRLQAQALAAELQKQTANATVLCGPRRATQETAALIAVALQAAMPHLRDDLSAPEDESTAALAASQEQAWSLIEAAKTLFEPDATLVLVTHDLIVRALVCRALSMPLDEMQRFSLQPGSMSTIEWRTQPRERLLIASLNEVCHLEEQITGIR
jgi:broad specificity phosphatase PhoE